jgi:hypothetical protein
MKFDKFETFNFDRMCNDFSSGGLERCVAKPDFGSAHAPHIDLSVRPTGQDTIKYRIFDEPGAFDLLNTFGPKGFKLP